MNGSERAKIPYLDAAVADGRVLLLMPLWDGQTWRHWVKTEVGLIEVKPVDAIRSNYVSTAPARDGDLFSPFVDFMWQRANWLETGRLTQSICDDFHMLGVSAAKLRHFHAHRNKIDHSLLASFVQTELEYLLTVARSVFDLLQEAVAEIWNQKVKLSNPAAEAQRRKLPPTFSKVVLENNKVRTSEQIAARFGLPKPLADCYATDADTFAYLRTWRDRIVHGGSSVDMIFVTEKGFCVRPEHPAFADFAWTPAHHYNDGIVSLLPWVANVIGATIEACTRLIETLAAIVTFPPEVAPGYRVFIRDAVNVEFAALIGVLNGQTTWWSDEPIAPCEPL